MLGEASFVGFIPVRDPVAARAFYAGTLELTVVEDTPFALVLDAAGTRLRVTPVPDLVVQAFTIVGWEVRRHVATTRLPVELGAAAGTSVVSCSSS